MCGGWGRDKVAGRMRPEPPSRLERMFRAIIARRWWIVAIYALLVPPAVYFGLKVEQDDSLDRLIVQTDPDYLNAKAFEEVFGGGEYVLLLAEAEDPFAPAVLARIDELERRLETVPKVAPSSVISIYRRVRGRFDGTPEGAEALRAFITGTDLFRRQGLVGDRFLAVPLLLDVRGPAERNAVLASIDAAIAGIETDPAPLTALRKIGEPYVGRYLETATQAAVRRYFPLFGLFIVVLNLTLYRSVRTLAAFLLTIGASAALTLGYVGATGGVLTIVSALVPMTILITCTATLVYVHSRFVDSPEDAPIEEHQAIALTNKFLPCTVSVFATAVGFAALAVSKIRPIREMGIWVAVGLLFTWIAVFTLFPALQRIFRTPTRHERRIAGHWLTGLTDRLPMFSYRWRWVLVPASLGLCILGAVSLFGLPGVVAPMTLETSALEYIDHDAPLYEDTKRFEQVIAGLSITEVWLRGPVGSVTEPALVRGLDGFARALESDPAVGAVIGPTTVIRMLRYTAGGGDRLPEDPAELEKLCADLEMLVPSEPLLQRFVDKATLSQTHLTVISRIETYEGFQSLARLVHDRWRDAVAGEPGLGQFEVRMAGEGPLQAKIAHNLVPTLIESFALTAAVIFGAFLLVFRNGPARLMAMIPSLFAILLMFGVMRVTAISLNVATILIASTVLGTSENDQIHFFHHFLEKRRSGSTEDGLRHTLRVAGKAIFFATMINAGGFLAFALSDLPPMRQFGILSAIAFTLSMIADFTALPAALWIVFRDKPDALKAGPGDELGRHPPGTRAGGASEV